MPTRIGLILIEYCAYPWFWIQTLGSLVGHTIEFIIVHVIGKKIAHALEENSHWSIVFDEVGRKYHSDIKLTNNYSDIDLQKNSSLVFISIHCTMLNTSMAQLEIIINMALLQINEL